VLSRKFCHSKPKQIIILLVQIKPKFGPMDQSKEDAVEHVWYMRPVFFVSDIQRADRFYVDKLGFKKKWHEADGEGTVCQVDRGGCEIILCQDTTRNDRCRVFLELSREGVDQLLKEVAERSVPTKKSWWGYDVLQVEDPDGNELLVCLENLL
jgi:catechol 2,3-dioxygenase-like lactoylglutathione lyase family enzyme